VFLDSGTGWNSMAGGLGDVMFIGFLGPNHSHRILVRQGFDFGLWVFAKRSKFFAMSMRFIMSMLVIACMTWSSSGAKHKKVMGTFASVDESEWFNPLENKDKVEAFIETWGGQGYLKK
jgi:hypothetical protein